MTTLTLERSRLLICRVSNCSESEVVEVVTEVSLGQFLLLSMRSSFKTTGFVEDIVWQERAFDYLGFGSERRISMHTLGQPKNLITKVLQENGGVKNTLNQRFPTL